MQLRFEQPARRTKGSKPKEDDEMNRVIGVAPVKRMTIILMGVGVLALAGLAAQGVLTADPKMSREMEPVAV